MDGKVQEVLTEDDRRLHQSRDKNDLKRNEMPRQHLR